MGELNQWEAAEPGVRRKITIVGNEIMSMIVEFEEGAEGYQHSHPHEQLSYVIRGQLEFTIDGVVTKYQEGDCIYIPPHAVHGVKAKTVAALLDVFTPLRLDLISSKTE